MSFLTSLFEARATPLRDPALAEFFGGGAPNSAGVPVTPDNALRSAAIYACVRVLAETIASLPLMMFERLGEGAKRRADDHPLNRMVHRAPNGWQSSAEFREGQVTAMGLRGVSYARIHVEPNGRRMLVPMHPDRTRAILREDGTLVYEYWQANGQRQVLLQEEVLRVPYLMRDGGVEPVSPIRMHAETVAQSLLAKNYTNTFLRNGGRPPGFVKMDAPFKDPEARERFKQRLREEIGGSQRGSTLLLEQGEYTPIGVSNDDAQLVDLCNMSVIDCARIYRMPPHMIQDLGRATWANYEQASLGFAVHTIGPWLVRWEQALSRDLLSEADQERYFFEFNVNGLLRGDAKTRADLYLKGRQGGWYSINDIRDLESMNRIENGDDYLQPLNFAPVGTVPTDKPGEADGDRTPPSGD